MNEHSSDMSSTSNRHVDVNQTTWRDYATFLAANQVQANRTTSPKLRNWPSSQPLREGYQAYLKTRAFALGIGTGASIMMFLTSILIMYAAYDPRSGAIHLFVEGGFYAVFRGSFLLCLWSLLFGCLQFVWRRTAVSYHACLGLPQELSYTATLLPSYSAFIAVFTCFVAFTLELVVPELFNLGPNTFFPLVAMLSPICLLLWPMDRAPFFFFSSPGSARARRFLGLEIAKTVLLGPLVKPTFLRTFIADILCSMPKLLNDFQFSVAYAAAVASADRHQSAQVNLASVTSSPAYSRLGIFLGVFPFALRLLQSLRAAWDCRRGNHHGHHTQGDATTATAQRHLLNACKYAASLGLVAVSVAQQKATSSAAVEALPGPEGEKYRMQLRTAWLLLGVFCTGCNFAWDMVCDWGLSVELFIGRNEEETDEWGNSLEMDLPDFPLVEPDSLARQDSYEDEKVFLFELATKRNMSASFREFSSSAPTTSSSSTSPPASPQRSNRPWPTTLSAQLKHHLVSRPMHRMYPRWVFLAVPLVNLVLRFGWAVYVSPHQEVVAQHTVLLLSSAELTRRAAWALVRVEWEQSKRHTRF